MRVCVYTVFSQFYSSKGVDPVLKLLPEYFFCTQLSVKTISGGPLKYVMCILYTCSDIQLCCRLMLLLVHMVITVQVNNYITAALSARLPSQVCLFCQVRTESRISFSSLQILFLSIGGYILVSCRETNLNDFQGQIPSSLYKVYCCMMQISWSELTLVRMV